MWATRYGQPVQSFVRTLNSNQHFNIYFQIRQSIKTATFPIDQN